MEYVFECSLMLYKDNWFICVMNYVILESNIVYGFIKSINIYDGCE